MMPTTSAREDGPPIELWRLALLPVGMIGGLMGGVAIGCYATYLLLHECVRKLATHWSWYDGWIDWAEGRTSQAKRGWYLLWLAWLVAFAILFFSIGWWLGLMSGPFVGAWVVLVPDGLGRLRAARDDIVSRFRRLEIRIEDPKKRDAA